MVLKHPSSETLSREEMFEAIATLLKMPIPSSLINATFDACDHDRSGKVTLKNFVRAMEAREEDLKRQFNLIDKDGSGEITLDELREAQSTGIFNAQEQQLSALLQAMDRVNDGNQEKDQEDGKIQWSEFRAMMILLPPATTIQTIVDLVKTNLENNQDDDFSDALLDLL